MRYFKCMSCYEIVGWIGLVTNLALSGLKMFVGTVAGSHALVVDGLYSAKDVVTSLLIVIGLKLSKQPIDKEHPFGHGKVEFLISLIISVILMGVVAVLCYYAAGTLMAGNHRAPHLIALWTAILSVLVNLFMHNYTHCVAVEINSPMVEILSRHHHSDGTSSMAVAAGIIGAHYLGMPWLDSVVAIGETIDLLYLGSKIFLDAFRGLMDHAAPEEIVQEIDEVVRGVSGVKTVEALRTRRVGQEVWIDLVIGVDPENTILEAKHIARRVEDALANVMHHLGDVTIHFKSMANSVPEFDLIRPLIAEALGLSKLATDSQTDSDTLIQPTLMLEDHSKATRQIIEGEFVEEKGKTPP